MKFFIFFQFLVLSFISEAVSGQDTLFFRNGNTLVGKISAIDENKVIFRSYTGDDTVSFKKYSKSSLVKAVSSENKIVKYKYRLYQFGLELTGFQFNSNDNSEANTSSSLQDKFLYKVLAKGAFIKANFRGKILSGKIGIGIVNSRLYRLITQYRYVSYHYTMAYFDSTLENKTKMAFELGLRLNSTTERINPFLEASSGITARLTYSLFGFGVEYRIIDNLKIEGCLYIGKCTDNDLTQNNSASFKQFQFGIQKILLSRIK
jgi:hypothetical protein